MPPEVLARVTSIDLLASEAGQPIGMCSPDLFCTAISVIPCSRRPMDAIANRGLPLAAAAAADRNSPQVVRNRGPSRLVRLTVIRQVLGD